MRVHILLAADLCACPDFRAAHVGGEKLWHINTWITQARRGDLRMQVPDYWKQSQKKRDINKTFSQ